MVFNYVVKIKTIKKKQGNGRDLLMGTMAQIAKKKSVNWGKNERNTRETS